MPAAVTVSRLGLFLISVSALLGESSAQGFLRQGMGMGGGMGRGMGMGMGRGMGMGGKPRLPPGMTFMDGEVVDMSNKVVQRVAGTGSLYYAWQNQKGAPIFRRRERDVNRKFIVFPDRNFYPGDGHYIVLRRMKRAGINRQRGGTIYEVFYLDLGDSINARVSQYNSPSNMAGVSGGAYGRRMKRKTEAGSSAEEKVPLYAKSKGKEVDDTDDNVSQGLEDDSD